ncbi:hypothetical protein CCMSSC00406_0010430 [Pleurotus cornucopiae]|uniref:Uncharacterized protein n=1 Tax=Pleurotus cornucopiae TaxID=5321 RepID=A0ACB7IMD8_PLECO|nr:hypothetical protein CCMSSC00406_0010430 [Pleurotus cornucopiae]
MGMRTECERQHDSDENVDKWTRVRKTMYKNKGTNGDGQAKGYAKERNERDDDDDGIKPKRETEREWRGETKRETETERDDSDNDTNEGERTRKGTSNVITYHVLVPSTIVRRTHSLACFADIVPIDEHNHDQNEKSSQ